MTIVARDRSRRGPTVWAFAFARLVNIGPAFAEAAARQAVR